MHTHKDTSTSTHTKYIKNPALTLREGKDRQRKRVKQEAAEKTNKDVYLFVHFNVEAIGHLIVLRRTEGQMFTLVTFIFTFSYI